MEHSREELDLRRLVGVILGKVERQLERAALPRSVLRAGDISRNFTVPRSRWAYPKMTACHDMILLSMGAPEMPSGGSLWRRLKSRIKRRRAGVDMVLPGRGGSQGKGRRREWVVRSCSTEIPPVPEENRHLVERPAQTDLAFFFAHATRVVSGRSYTDRPVGPPVVHSPPEVRRPSPPHSVSPARPLAAQRALSQAPLARTACAPEIADAIHRIPRVTPLSTRGAVFSPTRSVQTAR